MAYDGGTTGNVKTGLGTEFNVVPAATGIHVSLKNADAVTFVIYQATTATTIALKESIAGASEQVLPVVTTFYAGNGIGGVWTKQTQALDDAWSKTNTLLFDALVMTINAEQLSTGFDSVECTVNGGVCVAIVHGLKNKRAAANLPISGA